MPHSIKRRVIFLQALNDAALNRAAGIICACGVAEPATPQAR
jgi:hypothetical protein